MVTIACEQAVYGSFPDWDRGYDLLARSSGCRPDWLDAFRRTCQQYGEPSRGAEAGGLIVRPLPDRTHLIVRPSAAGSDDHGRPNALAFHALFVSAADLRRLDRSPFLAAPGLRDGWTTATTSLPIGRFAVEPRPPRPAADRLATAIAAGMGRGVRFAVESPGPIDELASLVWENLGRADRAWKTAATWTFSNSGNFDLLAAPRLKGLALGADYVTIEGVRADPAGVAARAASIIAARPSWFFRRFSAHRKLSRPPVEEA